MAADWSRPCRCGHTQAQHRGSKRTGGCFGWDAGAEKRCNCKGWRSANAKPKAPPPPPPVVRRRPTRTGHPARATEPDNRPLAKVIPFRGRNR